MSDSWMIAAIIEGIIILIGIWVGGRFAISFWWIERKRKKWEQGEYWSQVNAEITDVRKAFLGFYKVVAEYRTPVTGNPYPFKEWHHLSYEPAVGDPITVRVNFPDYPDEYYMDIEQSR